MQTWHAGPIDHADSKQSSQMEVAAEVVFGNSEGQDGLTRITPTTILKDDLPSFEVGTKHDITRRKVVKEHEVLDRSMSNNRCSY